MSDLDTRKRKYADLVVRKGVNIQPGQRMILMANTDPECVSLARMIQESAWAAGAADIMVHWADTESSNIKLRNASLEVLGTVPDYAAKAMNDYADADTVFVALLTTSPPPEGIDPEAVSTSVRARMAATKPMSDARMANIVRWNLIGVPTREWAGMVYPDRDTAEALEALWDAVLTTVRVDDGDPIANWDAHVARSFAHRDRLNAERFTELHFSNSLGTDLVVGLVDGYRFLATQETGADGIPFIANMPSEEIFSAPHRDRVNGTVVCSKPLFHNNVLIEGLRFTFENGKVVDFSAEAGAETMQRTLDTDEGARYLGEVALVPYDSAVNHTGLLYYNTLFDENAACHLAIGESYPETIEGGLEMDKDELKANGMNWSLEHVDFMFGTQDLRIVGRKADGSEMDVFVDGNWAW